MEAATQRGVVVMNTPGGNTISTAELVLRDDAEPGPQGAAGARFDGRRQMGSQTILRARKLCGKTLGVLGMGRIGSEVAKRALAFGMKVAGLRPVSDRSPRQSRRRRTGGPGRCLSRRGFHHRAHAGDGSDARHVERGGLCQDEAEGLHCELRARRNHRGKRSHRRAGLRQGRRPPRWMFMRPNRCRNRIHSANIPASPSRRTWAPARRKRRKNAASKSPKSSPAICSRVKCATR